MNQAGTPGPEVDPKEDLYRCITTPDWWVAEENRPSSAAFKHPSFSVDIVSLTTGPDYTLRRFSKGCGLVLFNCGDAKDIGFVARKELDPECPENLAHANVYNAESSHKKRKTMAQKLIEKILDKKGVIVAPTFKSS